MKKYYVLALFCLRILTADAQYTVLLNFNATNGAEPTGDLTLSVTGNVLYGMTSKGGVYGYGNIFSIDTNGIKYKDLFDFNGTNGSNPEGDLTLLGNTLYGMASDGGVHGYGCIFSIDTNGSGYTDMFDFDGTNGLYPDGSLTLSGNILYGMTSQGEGGNGNIFEIHTDGSGFRNLYSFDGVHGEVPYGSLTLSGKVLYGMTEGPYCLYGTVFSVDTNGTGYKDLINLANSGPCGSLIISEGILYGLTQGGGIYAGGNVFSIDTNGSMYKDMFDFNGTNGLSPFGSLILSGKTLYGMTDIGGTNNDGIIFSIDTNGSGYTNLLDFDRTNNPKGAYPNGSLVLSRNILYGMTWRGGTNDTGVVFKFQTCTLNTSASTINNIRCNGENTGIASANPSGGTTPYTYSWSGGGGTNSVISGLSAGTYTLNVTDNNGCTGSAAVIITQPTAINIASNSTNDTGICTGSAWVKVNGGISPYTYSWTGGNTTDSIFGKCHGSYCCTVTDANGCIDSVCITVTSTAGIDNVTSNAGQIIVYPNPNNGTFIIESLITNSQSLVEIYNMLGEKIYSETLSKTQINNTINLTDQPNGVYFYRVLKENGGLFGEGKIIVQK